MSLNQYETNPEFLELQQLLRRSKYEDALAVVTITENRKRFLGIFHDLGKPLVANNVTKIEAFTSLYDDSSSITTEGTESIDPLTKEEYEYKTRALQNLYISYYSYINYMKIFDPNAEIATVEEARRAFDKVFTPKMIRAERAQLEDLFSHIDQYDEDGLTVGFDTVFLPAEYTNEQIIRLAESFTEIDEDNEYGNFINISIEDELSKRDGVASATVSDFIAVRVPRHKTVRKAIISPKGATASQVQVNSVELNNADIHRSYELSPVSNLVAVAHISFLVSAGIIEPERFGYKTGNPFPALLSYYTGKIKVVPEENISYRGFKSTSIDASDIDTASAKVALVQPAGIGPSR